MRFAARFGIGVWGWTLASAAGLRSLGVLSADRLFITVFVGLLVVLTLTLPDRPTRKQLAATASIVAVGLATYAVVVVRQFQQIAAG